MITRWLKQNFILLLARHQREKRKRISLPYILHLHTTYYPSTQGSEVWSKIMYMKLLHKSPIQIQDNQVLSDNHKEQASSLPTPVSSLFTSPQQNSSLPPANSLENKNKGRTWPNSELSLPFPGHGSLVFGAINQAQTSRLTTPADGTDAQNGGSACCADITLMTQTSGKQHFTVMIRASLISNNSHAAYCALAVQK